MECITNSVGMKMVFIPPGKFLMGSPDSDKDALSNEKPQHRVRITRPFWLGAYPVTQAQFTRLIDRNPSYHSREADAPVDNVPWDDAILFCHQLSELEEEKAAGRLYRLPTEAEWEYACRAGTTTRWFFGDDPSALEEYAWATGASGTTVGQKKPNPWGLYDMTGFVHQLCADWYGKNYYQESPGKNPTGPRSGYALVRRGCSCSSIPSEHRCASRGTPPPPAHRGRGPGNYTGFRVAMTIRSSSFLSRLFSGRRRDGGMEAVRRMAMAQAAYNIGGWRND